MMEKASHTTRAGLAILFIIVLASGLLGVSLFLSHESARADTTPTVIHVTTIDDADPAPAGSLREAINTANSDGVPDIIDFSHLGSANAYTITPVTALPPLTEDGTTIDGYYKDTGYEDYQAAAGPLGVGSGRKIVIEIDGTNCPNDPGLTLEDATNCTIRGLAINHFDSYIYVDGANAQTNTIEGNYLGTDAAGTAGNGCSGTGVRIENGAHDNLIGGVGLGVNNAGNVISASGGYGVGVSSNCSGNKIQGNYIGTNSDGSAAIANSQNGVNLNNGCSNNTIGGENAGEGNLISGNSGDGVSISDSSTTGNQVLGNYIGTNSDGSAAIANSQNGVNLNNGCSNNTIGGTSDAERNVISGNNNYGVSINGQDTSGNEILGNDIGTDKDGINCLGNGSCGVQFWDSSGNYLGGGKPVGGGTDPIKGNIISGNSNNWTNVDIADGSSGNCLYGNWIGINKNGNPISNSSGTGVTISGGGGGGSQDNIIGVHPGGTGEGNVISGNSGNGIEISDDGSTGNYVMGNYIGTNSDGSAAIANSQNGVQLGNGCANNTIGGENPGEGNTISGNGGSGVSISGSGTTGNQVLGNFIGTDANHTLDLGNDQDGIQVASGANNNTIGGSEATRNYIRFNEQNGVNLNTSGCQVSHNTITDNGTATPKYIASAAPLSWEGIDYSGTFWGGSGCAFFGNSNDPTPVTSDGTGVPYADGTNDYSVVLLHDTTANLYETWYLRSDVWSGDPNNSGGFFDAYEQGTGDTIDRTHYYWQEHAFKAYGAGTDYTWSGTLPVATGFTSPPYLKIGTVQKNYKGSAAPLSYGGQDFSTTFWGTPGCIYVRNISMGEMQPAASDWTSVSYADGVHDFNLCLASINGNAAHMTFYVRDDYYDTASAFQTAFNDFAQQYGITLSVDDWEQSAWKANGAGNPYTWAGTPAVVSGFTSPPYLEASADVGYAGINLAGASGGTITGNTIDDNNGYGVSLGDSSSNQVNKNEIRNNTSIGVAVWDSASSTDKISQDSTYGNGGLGIDLLGDGVTPNDGNNNNPAKPNRGYNFPVFTGDRLPWDGSGSVPVSGTAPPNATVELYNVGSTPDASGHGQGYTYITSLTAYASGNFSTTLTGLSLGDSISAIAISPAGDPSGEGNTSEFSSNIRVEYPAPTVTSITPDTGLNNGPVSITDLEGTNFYGTPTVELKKTGQTPITATGVSLTGSTDIACTLNLSGATTGAWDVYVENPDGQGATLHPGFTVNAPPPPPAVTSFTPSSGYVGDTFQVDIYGSDFQNGASVKLQMAGKPDVDLGVSFVDSTHLRNASFALPYGTYFGNWNVVVTNPDSQTDTAASQFTVEWHNPNITPPLIPASGIVNTTVTGLEIDGNDFYPGATVQFIQGGTTETPSNVVVTGNKVTCDLDLTGWNPGPWDVVVTNADTQAVTSFGAFLVKYPTAPSISTLNPSKGNNDEMALPVTITGDSFFDGATVMLIKGVDHIQGQSVVVAPDHKSLTCTLTLRDVATGPWNVTVQNVDGQSDTKVDGFTVEYPPPEVTGRTPDNAQNLTNNVSMEVDGNYFRNGCEVRLEKAGQSPIVALNPVVNSTGHMVTCHFNFVDAYAIGASDWSLVVENDDHKASNSFPNFNLWNPVPNAVNIQPTTATNDNHAFALTINGGNFVRNATVRIWKNGQAPIIGVVNVPGINQLQTTFNINGAAVGTWNVDVFNPQPAGGTSTLNNALRINYPNAPNPTNIDPSSGINVRSYDVTIDGTGFQTGASVQLTKTGQTPIDLTIGTLTSTQITGSFDLTGVATGQWNVVVKNTDNQAGAIYNGFTVYPQYDVNASVTGGHGTALPATQKTDHGSNATINITPDAHYHIALITDNGHSVTINNPYVINNVTADHDVVVTFAIGQCTVNASVDGGHGTALPATQNVDYGSSASVSITPEAGYEVNSITDNGATQPIASPYAISSVVADHTIVVTFKKIPVTTYSFYFAEGYTGPNFVEYLCLSNPNSTTATANVTYLFDNGTTKAASYTVPATGRYTVNVNSEVGANQEVSMKVLSDTANLVAERPMYFNYQGVWTGGSDAIGATAPSTSWYFAEGSTLPNFDEYVTVLNPGDTAASLTFRYMVEGAGEQDVPGSVGPHSRATFNTASQIGAGKNSSLQLDSTQNVVAERPMYFNYHGAWTGGHDVVGANAPVKASYLAEGTTRAGFEEWLCLQNPGSSPITVNATYQLGSGQGAPIGKSYTVPAKQRLTVSVNAEIGPNKDDSLALTSTGSFIAERPMYFSYHGLWTGGHDVVGANATATTWFFAEGTTRNNFDEWLTLQNPGSADAHITITYYTSSGQAIPKSWTVSANSRLTVNVNQDAGANQDISAKVSSDQPIITERPMYFNYQGVWTGGHDVVGFVPQ